MKSRTGLIDALYHDRDNDNDNDGDNSNEDNNDVAHACYCSEFMSGKKGTHVSLSVVICPAMLVPGKGSHKFAG